MHPLVQNRHYTDVAVTKFFPVDEMLFVMEEKTIHSELSRNWSGHYLVRCNLLESIEKAGDVSTSLVIPPPIPCVLINLIYAKRSRFLNAHICQWPRPCFAQ